MSTTGQFSSKNPTIKRILKEASELASQPSADYHAGPLENDLFEWHFTLRGPPAPSPFANGLYHGRIVLPPAYPLKPPSFRFLTPSGRFEVNREICLSISGHHEETWQPAWGIRTALVAIRSFMDTDAKGQLGGMDASDDARRRLAAQSRAAQCAICARTNADIMAEQEDAVKAARADNAGDSEREEAVPEQLRLAYREDLGASTPAKHADANEATRTAAVATPPALPPAQTPPTAAPPHAVQRQRPPQDAGVPVWIDKAIYGIVVVLSFLIWKKLLP